MAEICEDFILFFRKSLHFIEFSLCLSHAVGCNGREECLSQKLKALLSKPQKMYLFVAWSDPFHFSHTSHPF